MKNIFQQLISSDYAELRGLHLTGTIPVDPSLLNELIRNFLDGESTPSAGGGPASSSVSKGDIDVLSLLRRRLKKLEVHTQGGRIVLEFEIKFD